MSHYVTFVVIPVARARLDDYRAVVARSGPVWKEHGALQYWECLADDVPPGKLTSFPQSVQLKDDETVVCAMVVFNSKAHHDEVMPKAMGDERLADLMQPGAMPFDGKRMFWGGFETLAEY